MANPAATNVTIELSRQEARFCELLDEFAKEGRKKMKRPDVEVEIPEVECRIAGGWVRDKLLGLPSSDLDITLSTCAGYPFAVAFTKYLTTLPLDPPIPIRSIGKVNANPDQSKHLETATTSIMGLECDFVQLRSEVYADGSRIPSEIRIGTPEEDALRRDITINTLFYNVHTRLIEDHTQLGLSDMANKLVRTPLDPLQTFRDDPLRVLRCVRFASRFGYELVDELKEAVKNEEILEALRTRISRERVGIELEKMLKGPDPHLSISLINSLKLYPHIFSVLPTTNLAPSSVQPTAETAPPQYCPAPHDTGDSLLAANLLQDFLQGELSRKIHPSILSQFKKTDTPSAHSETTAALTASEAPNGTAGGLVAKVSVKHLWLACALVPCRGGVVKDKKKEVSLMEAVIREGLKLGNVDVGAVTRLFSAASKLSNPQYEGIEDSVIRSKLDLAVLEIIDRYNAFVNRIEELGLPAAIQEKPRLDGNEINALLKLKPSPLTRILLQEVITWQFDHPQSTREECQEWLLQRQREGSLPTVEEPVKHKKGNNVGKVGKEDEEKRKRAKKA
ncbi:hypothetical protein QFC21_003065 [Naganishia friedmannii]|uniref:Uncharacterized protein n=1 Tax=Naganishia friedmannii TaxID=89922 RepID=A0ACC2VSU8_9TREE|nr:hypothetical protein QFC21_003065 [Naganishia friedmannii]